MGISAAATEAKAVALIVECRRCLAFGLDLKGIYVKDVLDQLESATTNDLSARVNYAPDNYVDGRTPGEITVIT